LIVRKELTSARARLINDEQLRELAEQLEQASAQESAPEARAALAGVKRSGLVNEGNRDFAAEGSAASGNGEGRTSAPRLGGAASGNADRSHDDAILAVSTVVGACLLG